MANTFLFLFAESVGLQFLFNLLCLTKYSINIDFLLCCHLVLFQQDRTDVSATITHENLIKPFLITCFKTLHSTWYSLAVKGQTARMLGCNGPHTIHHIFFFAAYNLFCLTAGPSGANRSPHIRVSGDTQLLLPRPPPPRGANTKLPATTATPLPSDGSYL